MQKIYTIVWLVKASVSFAIQNNTSIGTISKTKRLWIYNQEQRSKQPYEYCKTHGSFNTSKRTALFLPTGIMKHPFEMLCTDLINISFLLPVSMWAMSYKIPADKGVVVKITSGRRVVIFSLFLRVPLFPYKQDILIVQYIYTYTYCRIRP